MRKALISQGFSVWHLNRPQHLVGEGVIRGHLPQSGKVRQVALDGLDDRHFTYGETGQLATTVVLLSQDTAVLLTTALKK